MKASIRDTLNFSGIMLVGLLASVPVWLVLFGSRFGLEVYLDPRFWGWILAVWGGGTVVYWALSAYLRDTSY